MSSFAVSTIIEKMSSFDSDIRFMGLNDLISELAKDTFRLDYSTENTLITTILKLLSDQNNELQSKAVEAIGDLIGKIKDSQITNMIDRILEKLLGDNEEFHDISALALREIVKSLPKKIPVADRFRVLGSISKHTIPQLLKGVKSTPFPENKLRCIDIIRDCLVYFGSLFQNLHEEISIVTLSHITAFTAPKRVIDCLCHLSVNSNDILFNKIAEDLTKHLTSETKNQFIRAYLQAILAISHVIGYRLAPHLDKIIPSSLPYCQKEKYETDYDLRETCLQSYESFVSTSPKEVAPYIKSFIDICINLISHDPNYLPDDESEDEDSESEDQDESDNGDDEDDSDIDDEVDDDDLSWKVRKGSAKLLSALFRTRPEQLDTFYKEVAPVLIGRFDEREENVKLSVFEAFRELLAQTEAMMSAQKGHLESLDILNDNIDKIVKQLALSLKQTSLKTRVGALSLITSLSKVTPKSLEDQIGKLIPGIQLALKDKSPSNSKLIIHSLSTINNLISNTEPKAFIPHIESFLSVILELTQDKHFKISSEALKVCKNIAIVIKPVENSDQKIDSKKIGKEIYEATFSLLKETAVDQEVKEAAIDSMATILSHFGNELGNAEQALHLLLEKLSNEITRVAGIKAFQLIAESPIKGILNKVLPKLIETLAQLLRKKKKILKQTSIRTLETILKYYGADLPKESYTKLFIELSNLIQDQDLYLAHLTMRLSYTILESYPVMAKQVVDHILPKVLNLSGSPLLQGVSLRTMLTFFSKLVPATKSLLKFDDFIQPLIKLVLEQNSKEISKQIFTSVPQIIAAICQSSDEKEVKKLVTRFVSDVQSNKDQITIILALCALGEIGRNMDLSYVSNLQKVVLGCFNNSSEDIKAAASFSFGNLSAGNMDFFLPVIFERIQKIPKEQYLLFRSLREVISRNADSERGLQIIKPHISKLLEILFLNCENENEGTRNVVSECLGKLALFDPVKLIPELKKHTTSASPLIRTSVVSAFKYCITKDDAADSVIQQYVGDFMECLGDKDYIVRKSALNTLNFIAHSKPALVRDLIPKILSKLYSETIIKPELIRVIKLGPFTHEIDDGLENRKAAFDTMNTLLTTSYNLLNISDFIAHVQIGVDDSSDEVITSAFGILNRLIVINKDVVRSSLDSFVEPLKKIVTKRLKPDAVQQEIQKNEEVIANALSVIVNLKKIPDSERALKFTEFIQQTILRNSDLKAKFEAIEQGKPDDLDDHYLSQSSRQND
eukprot:Anaeramoba_ignava/a90357_2275.p1 GENE.a90357_2275~~a90357_2275.p1  ORF type:complete len:1246 (-),score=349.01 a90357_2275:47-3784(-)